MKKVLVFLRQRWSLMLLAIALLIVFPAGLFASSSWRSGIRRDVEAMVNKDFTELKGASSINYSVPSLLPDAPAVQMPFAPNERVIAWFREQRDSVMAEAGTVFNEALAFNKGDHTVLVEDLFPAPARGNELLKPNQMVRRYASNAHTELLASVGAGTPPDPTALAAALAEQRTQAVARLTGDRGEQALTPEQAAALEKELSESRVGRLAQRAAQIGFYADTGIFPLPPVDSVGRERVSLAAAWDLQERYWIHADLLRAVRAANAGAGGRGVPGGVVKKIESIVVDPPAYPTGAGEPREGEPDSGSEGGNSGGEGGSLTTDYSKSVTGRVSGPGTSNTFFDVRTATMTAIVATRELPRFIDALAATNFMSVLDVDLERVEPLDQLRLGFYFGDEPVVRATMRIETVWLREWTAPLMPKEVRAALGIAEPEAPENAGEEAQPNGGG